MPLELGWDVLALLGLAAFASGFVDAISGGGGMITMPCEMKKLSDARLEAKFRAFVCAAARKVTRSMVDPSSHIETVIDLGFVGEPERVVTAVLDAVLGRELIPVLAPVANGSDGETYNINADTFAGAVAGKMKAKRLLLLTDVPGVLDKNKNLIKELKIDQIHALIADGTITGGMIPKVETCIYALEQGVEGVVILDGKVPHAVLLELLTDHGSGTLITR